MNERCGDPIAKRIFVSVSKKSRHWPQAWSYDKEIVDVAIDLIKSKDTAAQVAYADTMLVVQERWPMRIWIIFDIFNTEYDPSKAHLPGQNDLPVIAISLSNKTTITNATEGLENRVNKGVREAHDLHGDGSRAPFKIDHANNNIPTFPSPRTRTTVTPKS
ncbi:hypothetical protein CDEST_02046 [Colletotrichum destructivum]|uniref:Uncharacterized protein n=1 Tax=Colletotrichum destructivum TaxID=34406 RepID=A0AAX4I104_9PEZI|nr:hypothetical protein CDEST_02046 [Colletotrichum destructivum]